MTTTASKVYGIMCIVGTFMIFGCVGVLIHAMIKPRVYFDTLPYTGTLLIGLALVLVGVAGLFVEDRKAGKTRR